MRDGHEFECVMKHNERARVAPLPFVHRKYMNGRLRRVAACGGLRQPFATPPLATLPLATLPPATLMFATLPACGGLRPPDAPRRRPAAPPCGGVPRPRPAAAAYGLGILLLRAPSARPQRVDDVVPL